MSREGDEHDQDAGHTAAALPPTRGRGFARSWWGRAWLRALEDAALDAAAVKTGRRLARVGGVGAVTVRPGRVTAVVRDAQGSAHRADVLVPELSAREWGRFLDLAVEQAGHMAALLDGELPPHLVEDAAVHGIDLLPGPGDLDPECGCGTWDHCGHTAALCHQVARLLDDDPFLLLLMRGRAKDAFLTELHVRGTAPKSSAGVPGAGGVDAAEAWAASDILPPLPELPGLPQAPGTPPCLGAGSAPDPASGVDPSALEHLAGRTAVEAYRLLAQDLSAEPRNGTCLTAAQDAVRLACGTPPGAVTERLAAGTGRGRAGLALAVRAWRLGGGPALGVLDEERQLEDAALVRARAALEGAWEAAERPPLHRSGNRWTIPGGGVQLRLGGDGRWWPYRDEGGHWAPTAGPEGDPATALASTGHGTRA
ncbi:SWF or SNF family helicase [Streptomyces sp. NPDC048514]|uniref:SWIM zinc finger family protein n=1 Tax=Streptomyces sp. NPDC048514 TaxID=3365564 RepID=UPI003715930B